MIRKAYFSVFALFALTLHGVAPSAPSMSNARILGNEVYQWLTSYKLPDVAQGKIIGVTDQASLLAAVEAATGGELILLAPGNYGSFRIIGKQFEQPVILAAAPGDRAQIESLKLGKCMNIRLENLHFALPPTTNGKGFYGLLRLDNVADIQVRNCTFTGAFIDKPNDPRHGFADGIGIFGGNWDRMLIEYCEFTALSKCTSAHDIENTTIAHNYLHDYRQDAFFLAHAKNCLIEFNLVEDNFAFHLDKGKGDHPDMLQGNLDHVIIRNNYFNQGKGTASQGIFISGISKKQSNFVGSSVVVENNLIHVGLSNAIMLGNLSNSIVRNNTLLENRNGKTVDWAVKIYTRGDSEGTVLENNMGPRIDANGGATGKGNITFQRTNPEASDYVNNYVANGIADEHVSLEDFRPVPGPDGQLRNAGADFSVFEFWIKD